MVWTDVQKSLTFIQHWASIIGILIILTGILIAFFQYLHFFFTSFWKKQHDQINHIRLVLARILILGLEFIVAADLIGTITAPDYYTVGLLAIIVAIRTLLNYSLNRELAEIR